MSHKPTIQVGFFNDHKYIVDKKEVYSTGALNAQVWERFLVMPESRLLVVGRLSGMEQQTKGNKCNRDRVDFCFLPSFSNIRSLLGLNPDITQLERLVLQCDVVIARLPSEIGMRAISTAKANSIPCGVEVVGCGFDALCNNGSFFASAYAPLFYLKMRRSVRQADAVLYVTENFLQKRYPSNSPSISASNVEINEIAPKITPSRTTLTQKDYIDIKLIGTVENDLKGIDVAIKAIKIIHQAGYNAHLTIIGGGDPKRFKGLIRELGLTGDIHFFGFISDRSILMDQIDNADIYIQPSRQEGLPRSTIESMSRGCPVCSSTAGGLPELTLSEFTHTPGDYKKLASDITHLIRDKSALEMNAKNSLYRAERYLSDSLAHKRNKFWNDFIFRAQAQKSELQNDS